MKHNDLLHELGRNAEYNEAMESLNLHFAVADAVVRARLQKGWSQAELASAVGTKQANISRIEAGLANPTLSVLQKLFQVLSLEMNIINPAHEANQKLDIRPSSVGISIHQNEAKNWLGALCSPHYEEKVLAAQATEILK